MFMKENYDWKSIFIILEIVYIVLLLKMLHTKSVQTTYAKD